MVTAPTAVDRRRYEALRAYTSKAWTLQQVADRVGYTPAGEPGPPTPQRRAVTVRPAGQARTQERTTQGPGPRASDRTTAAGPVRVWDQGRALAAEGTAAQPHRRRPDPRRGRVRPAVTRTRTTRGPASTPPPPAATPGWAAARVIDFAAFPDRFDTQLAGLLLSHAQQVASTCRCGCTGRLPRHERHPRRLPAAVPARAQAHPHPPGLPRRRPAP